MESMRREPERRLSAKDADATRNALIRAGRDVFAELGFGGAKVDRIARKAGVNKAMINYHFRGKKGLYQAVIRAFVDEIHDRMAPIKSGIGDPEQRLRGFIRVMAGTLGDYPAYSKIMIREVISGGQQLEGEQLDRFFKVFELLKSILEQGIRNHVFRPANPLFTHASIISGLLFFRATEQMRTRLAERESLPEDAMSGEAFSRHLESQILDSLIKPT